MPTTSCLKNLIRRTISGLSMISFLMLIPLLQASCKKSPIEPEKPTGHIHGIVPLPFSVETKTGNLSIDESFIILNNSEFHADIISLEASFRKALGKDAAVADPPVFTPSLSFQKDESLGTEAYRIEISKTGIKIFYSGAQSAFYATQSLRQMIWNASVGKSAGAFTLGYMTITDAPVYSWRGFHLDVSRHMFTKEFLFKVIDRISYYKLNKLHLHLNDDQGWRLQIDQFPLLTEVGGWRPFNRYDSTCMDLMNTDLDYAIDQRFVREHDGEIKYGGFYTRDDIRQLIAYAEAHFVEIIPEIDMPGHMSAAIMAYPYLSCTGTTGWGSEFSYPVCPCNPEVMDFAFKTWDEVADLFPSKYVHVGCDEVDPTTWAQAGICQDFMQEQGITTASGIQDYFMKQLGNHLEQKGKKVIAWDDAVKPGTDTGVIAMYWRDWLETEPEEIAGNGNSIILSPWTPFYLSSDNSDQALQTLFSFDPGAKYSEAVNQKVIGLQSCLWTEIIPSENMFEKYCFPRIQALSEICWSSSHDWNSFKTRMKPHLSYMDSEGIHYHRPFW